LLLDFEPRCPDARDIWRIAESQEKHESGYLDPLKKGIIRKAREYKNLAWASYSADKLRLGGIGVGYGPVKPTVEPGQWLGWAQSKQHSIKELSALLKVTQQGPLFTKPPVMRWRWLSTRAT